MGKLFRPRSLLTFGWLNFNEILPLGSPLNLRLHLKNISQNDFPINGAISNFFIRYPGDPEYPPKKDNESQHYQIPSRMWSIQIPSLSCGSTYIDFSENFFFPETAGPHELIIDGINGVRMAGPFGIGEESIELQILVHLGNTLFMYLTATNTNLS